MPTECEARQTRSEPMGAADIGEASKNAGPAQRRRPKVGVERRHATREPGGIMRDGREYPRKVERSGKNTTKRGRYRSVRIGALQLQVLGPGSRRRLGPRSHARSGRDRTVTRLAMRSRVRSGGPLSARRGADQQPRPAAPPEARSDSRRTRGATLTGRGNSTRASAVAPGGAAGADSAHLPSGTGPTRGRTVFTSVLRSGSTIAVSPAGDAARTAATLARSPDRQAISRQRGS